MKDHLLDLVSHTVDLGCIDIIKIVGDENTTLVDGKSEDNSVVLRGEFHGPAAEFVGKFGMPNLGKLKILLNIQEYKENAKLSITRKDDTSPDGINFENADGDFKNNYRFMASEIIEEKIKRGKFREPTWHVEFEPTVAGIQRLKMQAQANAEETVFKVRTEDGNLKFLFGDHSSHAGNFVFQHNVTGQIKHAWAWPVSLVQNVLSLSGDKVMRISDDGAMMIIVDSGLIKYEYILPAQTK